MYVRLFASVAATPQTRILIVFNEIIFDTFHLLDTFYLTGLASYVFVPKIGTKQRSIFGSHACPQYPYLALQPSVCPLVRRGGA